MDAALRERVRERANNLCEYCRLRQEHQPVCRLHLEHIVPRQHGGVDEEENLALACYHCNLHKGTNLSGIDPASGAVVRLYHPRRDRWTDHFAWRGVELAGLTATGAPPCRCSRSTRPAAGVAGFGAEVEPVRLNRSRRGTHRSALGAFMAEGPRITSDKFPAGFGWRI